MLTLEKFLADNCDVICIVCESAGSLVELGAFTNNEHTFKKIIALISNKYSKNKSFIMLGPIKQIRKNDRNNVIFYGKDIDKVSNELIRQFRNKKQLNINKLAGKGLDKIIGQYYFILILLYYFESINVKNLVKYLHFIEQEKNKYCRF